MSVAVEFSIILIAAATLLASVTYTLSVIARLFVSKAQKKSRLPPKWHPVELDDEPGRLDGSMRSILSHDMRMLQRTSAPTVKRQRGPGQ